MGSSESHKPSFETTLPRYFQVNPRPPAIAARAMLTNAACFFSTGNHLLIQSHEPIQLRKLLTCENYLLSCLYLPVKRAPTKRDTTGTVVFSRVGGINGGTGHLGAAILCVRAPIIVTHTIFKRRTATVQIPMLVPAIQTKALRH